MSRFWSHTPYAEDQPYSHSILYVHVLTRAAQTGALVGAGISSTALLLRRFRLLKPQAIPSSFSSSLLRSAGVGTVAATAIFTIIVPLRMLGRGDIEWKDRSWRLLENKGQVECDDWTYGGMAAGAASAFNGNRLGWRGIAGRTGIGGVVGMLGYMGWRYGVKQGNFEEKS